MEKHSSEERQGETHMLTPRIKVSEVLEDCPDCGKTAELFEETFYGKTSVRFRVKCRECGRKTAYYVTPYGAVSGWNKKHFVEQRTRDYMNDEDGLTKLMGQILKSTMKDYRRLASREHPDLGTLVMMRDLESFILDNPYMLPYDPDFVLEQMQKSAEKARKKQVS